MEWFTDDPRRGQTALTLIALAVTVAIVVFGRKRLLWAIPCASIWLLLAAVVIPSYMPARPVAYRNACINNLRMIQDAKAHWASKSGKLSNAIPTKEELYGVSGTNGFIRHRLTCPRGGIYTFGTVGENPRCSLSEKRAQVGVKSRAWANESW